MHTRIVRLFAIILFLAVPATSGLAANTNRHVIVISLDGFSASALDDPTLPLPALRALAREGVRADAMVPVNPTVTWPNHTTIVTGVDPARHGLLYNGLPVKTEGESAVRMRVEPHVDKRKLVLAPTLYDVASAAGLTTAEVDWVAIEHADTITWAFPEYGETQGAVAREMIAKGVLTQDELQRFGNAPITFRDEIWNRAAEYILTTHRPNLLLVHFLTTDSVQHQFGPDSLAAKAALVLADARVARLVTACRRAGMLETTTFVIVSDHGFKTYRRRIRPNVVLAKHGLASRVWTIPEGGTAMVYVTDASGGGRTIAAIQDAFKKVPGIKAVLPTDDLHANGFPTPADTDRMAPIVLVAEDGYAFEGSTEGEPVDMTDDVARGAHGYPNTDPAMRAIFIASGAGVRSGGSLGVIRNLDIAPTIARWLGVELEDTTGSPLRDIIE
jgi:predicted AlkP superfamily pyrophosphatase or phosphodiesterase